MILSVSLHHVVFLSTSSSQSLSFIALALSISTGMKKSDTNVAAILPKMSATPNPPKIGSVAKSNEPKMMATAVSMMGFALVAVAIAMARRLAMLFSAMSEREKSIRSNELLAEIPIREMKPMREVAVKKKCVSVA